LFLISCFNGNAQNDGHTAKAIASKMRVQKNGVGAGFS